MAEQAKTDLKACMDKVTPLIQNETLYKAMLSEPILVDNKLEDSIFDIRTYATKLRTLYDASKHR